MSGALSANDITYLRQDGHTAQGYLTIVQPATIATARINQSSFTRPLAEFEVDNTSAGWSDVEAGMTVRIGTTSGGNEIGTFRVRGSDADTLKISEYSTGDTGLTSLSELASIGDNAYVTVLNDFNLWAKFSRIALSGGVYTFYKDYETAYSTQNETTPPFIVNLGDHVAGFVNTGTNVLTDSRTNSPTYFLTETTSTYLNDVGDGTITIGSTSTQSFTATYPVGNRWIKTTVTASSGATKVSRRYIHAHNTTTDVPYKVRRVTSDRVNRNGRRMSLELDTPISNTEIPDGSMVIYWEVQDWGGDTVSDATTQFVGYANTGSLTQTPGQTVTSIQVVSALELLGDVIAVSQQLAVVSDPTHWQEFLSTLSHVDFVIYYLLYWQTTLVDLFDFNPSGLSSYQMNAWSVDPGNIPQQLNQVIDRLNGWVGQVSSGAIYIDRDYIMKTSSQQAATATRMTLTGQDVSEAAISNRIFRPKVGKVSATAFSGSTVLPVAVFSKAPGRVGGQGASEYNLQNQLVLSPQSTGQNELNERAASKLAQLNNPIPTLDLTIPKNYSVFEPATGDIVHVTLTAAQSPTGEAIDTDCSVLEVSRSYGTDGSRSHVITVEPYASGLAVPGQTIIIPPSKDAPDINFETGLFDFSYDPFDELTFPVGFVDNLPDSDETQTGGVVIAGQDSNVGLSYQKSNPEWIIIYTADDRNQDFILDPNSAYYLGGGIGALAAWLLDNNTTDTETTLKYCTDVLAASPSWESKQTLNGEYQFLRTVRGVSGGIGAFGLDQTGSEGYYLGDAVADVVISDDGTGGFVGDGVLLTTGSDGKLWGVVYTLSETNAASLSKRMSAAQTGGSGNDNMWPDTSDSNDAATYIYTNEDTYGIDTALNPGSWVFQPDITGHKVPFTTNRWAGWQHGFNINGTSTFSNIRPIYYGDASATATLVYSADSGDNVTENTFGDGTGVPVGDCDDFDLGIWICAQGDQIQYTTAYNGTFSTATGYDAGSTTFSCLRIPFYKFSDPTSLNNSATALEFIACTKVADSSQTIVYGALNSSTGAISGVTDITATVASVDYAVLEGANMLETFSGNPNIIRCIARDESDDTEPIVLLERNAAGTWSVAESGIDYQYVLNTGITSLWVAGEDGLDFSSDSGDTISSRDGNFFTEVGGAPVNFVQVTKG